MPDYDLLGFWCASMPDVTDDLAAICR